MAEKAAETPQPVQAESIGKVEPDPANPELRRGKIAFEVIISSDGFIFTNPKAALDHEAAMKEARTKV